MTLYDTDFYQWTQQTARQLRDGAFTEIDIVSLLDEVEDLGKRQKAASQSRLAVLIAHLLKWDTQPARRSRSWQATIQLQRNRIQRLLKSSPSLKPFLSEILEESYQDAVLLAIRDTGLSDHDFDTRHCVYTLEEILSMKDVTRLC